MGPIYFWDVAQHILVVGYWCFGTTYKWHLQVSVWCHEVLVAN